MRHVCFFSFLWSLSVFALSAQTVTVDGEIRPRTEYQDGFSCPLPKTSDPGIFGIQRTRLNAVYATGTFRSQITFQDARTFGQTSNSSETATTSIFEAWTEMLVLPGGSVKIGRQALKYDDNRIFSASAWSNTGSSHDVVLFKYAVDDFQGHLGFAYNNNTAIASETYYTPGAKYRYMGFCWLTKNLGKALHLSFLGVDEGVQTGTSAVDYGKEISMNHVVTYGGNLKYKSATFPLSFLATAYFQDGKNSKGILMSGKMAALRLNGECTERFIPVVGMDYYSGDARSDDNQQKNFKKLYGTNHSFNGYMGYWSTLPTLGLLDYYGSVTAKITSKWRMEGVFHLFNTEKEIKDGSKETGRNLGSELDWVLTCEMNAQSTLEAGWSTYFVTDNTKIVKGMATDAKIRTPQWAYLMLTVKPTFFSTKSTK